MRQVVGFGDRSTRRGVFGGEFGARYCNQWGLYGVRVRQRRDAALFPNYFGQTCCQCCDIKTTSEAPDIFMSRILLVLSCLVSSPLW